jgi:DNA-binding transcriptional regulator YiaG
MNPQQILDLRRRLRLTQDELARLLGFNHRSAVSRLEDGSRDPTPAVLRLLKMLQADPAEVEKKLAKISNSC